MKTYISLYAIYVNTLEPTLQVSYEPGEAVEILLVNNRFWRWSQDRITVPAFS
jgi:hypothetical protein